MKHKCFGCLCDILELLWSIFQLMNSLQNSTFASLVSIRQHNQQLVTRSIPTKAPTHVPNHVSTLCNYLGIKTWKFKENVPNCVSSCVSTLKQLIMTYIMFKSCPTFRIQRNLYIYQCTKVCPKFSLKS